MAKLLPIASASLGAILTIGLLALAPCSCNATTYIVGDSPGWDISTNLDTWASGKTFNVGDILVFQYSSSNRVEEVNKDSFDNCSTTNALQTFSNGNTSIPLTRAGPWYFIAGNRLYCLGGMKLEVNVVGSSQAGSPAGAPFADPGGSPAGDSGAFPRPSSRSDNPSVPASSGSSIIHGGKLQGLVLSAFLGILGPLLLILSRT